MFEVFEAQTEEQKAELFRFRYEVFVREQHKYVQTADHDRKSLHDELDHVATHLCLTENGRMVGSLRQVRGRRNASASMVEHFGLGSFETFPDTAFSFTGRLLILPNHRGSRGLLPLLQSIYDQARAAGVLFDFLHCRPQLVKLYEQVGYRRYRPHFQHPELGYQIPMALVLDDVPHLDRVRSPLLSRARRLPNRPEYSTWFNETFPDYASTVSPVTSPEEFLGRLAARVNAEEMPLVDGLDESELQQLIASSQHLKVEAGAHLVGRGDMGPELFLVLDGIAEVRGQVRGGPLGPVLNTFGRGDFFGEMSVLTGKPRSSDIFAKTALEVIFIDQLTLRRFVRGQPTLGAKLLFNIAKVLAERLDNMSERWLSDCITTDNSALTGDHRKSGETT